MTVRKLLAYMESMLKDNARQEALWLCARAAGVEPARLLARVHEEAPWASCALEYARRRADGEPLQYILGTQPFIDFEVLTDRRALIPRPDTETLLRAALGILEDMAASAPTVLELCTGSGAVAAALLRYTGAAVTATDISADCLALARENAVRLGVEHRLTLLCGDLFDAVPRGARYDVLLANPPYVRTGDIPSLAREVRDWEPLAALDGGPDGLAFYRRIAARAHDYVKPGGALLLEVGAGQAPSVAAMLHGWERLDIIKDEEGVQRVVAARRAAAYEVLNAY